MTELQIKARLFEISEELRKLDREEKRLVEAIKRIASGLNTGYLSALKTTAEEIRKLSQQLVDNISRTQALVEEEDALRQKLEEVQQ